MIAVIEAISDTNRSRIGVNMPSFLSFFLCYLHWLSCVMIPFESNYINFLLCICENLTMCGDSSNWKNATELRATPWNNTFWFSPPTRCKKSFFRCSCQHWKIHQFLFKIYPSPENQKNPWHVRKQNYKRSYHFFR